MSDIIDTNQSEANTTEQPEVIIPNRNHYMMDTAVIWCSYPHDSMKSIHGLSPFISSLCDTFDLHGTNGMTVDNLATEVNKKMRGLPPIRKQHDGKKLILQLMSKYEGGLTKDCRFYNTQVPLDLTNDCYHITGKRDCLIIPIERYSGGLTNRRNALHDAQHLRSSFLRLQFRCHVMPGFVTLKSAQTKIRELLAQQQGKDMFALCIMAHGGPNKLIMFSDGRSIRLQNFIKQLLICPELTGKPKIVVIQACRGSAQSYQGATMYNPFSHSDHPEYTVPVSRTLSDASKEEALIGDDIVELWASPPENQAFRTGYVSFFVDSLCRKLDDFGETKDIQYIFKKVTAHMRDRDPVELQTPEGIQRFKLASYIEHRLTKKVIFFSSDPRRDGIFVDDAKIPTKISQKFCKSFSTGKRRMLAVIMVLLFLVGGTACGLFVYHLYVHKNYSSGTIRDYNENSTCCSNVSTSTTATPDTSVATLTITPLINRLKYKVSKNSNHNWLELEIPLNLHNLSTCVLQDQLEKFFIIIKENETNEIDKDDSGVTIVLNYPTVDKKITVYEETFNEANNWETLLNNTPTKLADPIQMRDPIDLNTIPIIQTSCTSNNPYNNPFLYIKVPTKKSSKLFSTSCIFNINECLIPWSGVSIAIGFKIDSHWTQAFEYRNDLNIGRIRLSTWSDETILKIWVSIVGAAFVLTLVGGCKIYQHSVKRDIWRNIQTQSDST